MARKRRRAEPGSRSLGLGACLGRRAVRVTRTPGLGARLWPLDPGYFAHAKFRDDNVGRNSGMTRWSCAKFRDDKVGRSLCHPGRSKRATARLRRAGIQEPRAMGVPLAPGLGAWLAPLGLGACLWPLDPGYFASRSSGMTRWGCAKVRVTDVAARRSGMKRWHASGRVVSPLNGGCARPPAATWRRLPADRATSRCAG
jgi:hypothetical protein